MSTHRSHVARLAARWWRPAHCGSTSRHSRLTWHSTHPCFAARGGLRCPGHGQCVPARRPSQVVVVEAHPRSLPSQRAGRLTSRSFTPGSPQVLKGKMPPPCCSWRCRLGASPDCLAVLSPAPTLAPDTPAYPQTCRAGGALHCAERHGPTIWRKGQHYQAGRGCGLWTRTCRRSGRAWCQGQHRARL